MKALSTELLATVDAAEARLQAISEANATEPALTGGWSRKQLIGHLIDSASNNHQRFVRAALSGALAFPAYDTDGWAGVENAQEAAWGTLVALWANYNRYLAHVVSHLPADKLDVLVRIGPSDPVTLRYLAEDYLSHLQHHLRQIGLA